MIDQFILTGSIERIDCCHQEIVEKIISCIIQSTLLLCDFEALTA